MSLSQTMLKCQVSSLLRVKELAHAKSRSGKPLKTKVSSKQVSRLSSTKLSLMRTKMVGFRPYASTMMVS